MFGFVGCLGVCGSGVGVGYWALPGFMIVSPWSPMYLVSILLGLYP